MTARTLVAAAVALLVPFASDAADRSLALKATSHAPVAPSRTASTPPRVSVLRVRDPDAFARAKAESDREAREATETAASASSPDARLLRQPATIRNWEGIRSREDAPSDSTSAVGTKRFLELINSRFAIYTRDRDRPASTGTLFDLAGCLYCDEAADPQILWDAGTRRFYVVFVEYSGAGAALTFAFSKGPAPDSAADFCGYSLDFGGEFPDFPKLGDTSRLALIGINVFEGTEGEGDYLRSAVVAITKPPKGPDCPAPETFVVSEVTLVDSGTPVPANQIDRSREGWIVATGPTTAANVLKLFSVTSTADGTAVIDAVGKEIVVPKYRVPSNAPQKDTTKVLDTLDGRFTQAVTAFDPLRDAIGLWTQHTVFGGAGAEVRWYEIDPYEGTLMQSGKVSSDEFFAFNGAISPDRVRRAKTRLFGSSMVLSFNTSSATAFPGLAVVSKNGDDAQSAPLAIAVSTGPSDGYDCYLFGPCRWGDYAGATPDPMSSPAATRGTIWGTSMLASPTLTVGDAEWRTRNFVVRP